MARLKQQRRLFWAAILLLIMYLMFLVSAPLHTTLDPEVLRSLQNDIFTMPLPSLDAETPAFQTTKWNPNAKPNRVVWQTWKSHTVPYPAEWNQMRKRSPNHEFRVVNDTEMVVFMKEHFRGPVYDAFMSIHPKLFPAITDLWRYCTLYKYGGVYMDMDSGTYNSFDTMVDRNVILSPSPNRWEQAYAGWNRCTPAWEEALNMTFPQHLPFERPPGVRPTLFKLTTHALVQWMLIFPVPGHPILKELIEIVVMLLSRWKETDKTLMELTSKTKIICTTGPGVFAMAVVRVWQRYHQNLKSLQTEQWLHNYAGKADFMFDKFDKVKMRNGQNYEDFHYPLIKGQDAGLSTVVR